MQIIEGIKLDDSWTPLTYVDGEWHPIKNGIRYYNVPLFMVLENGVTVLGVFDITSSFDNIFRGRWLNCNHLEFTKKVIAWKEVQLPKALE